MPEHEILVQDNTVLLVERRVVKVVGLDSFLQEAAASSIIDTGILPAGCLSYLKTPKCSMIVLETPARMTTLKHANDAYRVSMPFLQFYLRLSNVDGHTTIASCTLSCSKRPVRSKTDALLRSPTPNTYPDGRVCLGGIRVAPGSLTDTVRDFMQKFWGSPFNNDLHPGFPHFSNLNDITSILRAWQDASTVNPFFALEETTKYLPHVNLTMEGVIKQCVR